MDIKQILTADVLDIIFEGRNKDYGAYELRKTYNKRLVISLFGTAVFLLLFYSGYVLAKNSNQVAGIIYVNDRVLEKIPEKKVEPPIEIPPKKPAEIKPVQTRIYSTPLIVDKVVPAEEMPPNDEIEKSKIGIVNIEGESSTDFVAPPMDGTSKGIVTYPKKQEADPDSTFIRVEIESEYPGGTTSWIRFLRKNLTYPDAAVENQIQGTVTVRFIVDREGNVSDIEAVSGPDELKSAAAAAIKKSGKWTPAIQNGRKVKSYKSQPITFQLASE